MLREGRVLVRKRDLAAPRGEAVAEASVDRLLGGPQRGDRLSALMCVVELCAHQGPEDTAAAMGRVDADDGHTGCRDVPARDGHVERESAGTADDGSVR